MKLPKIDVTRIILIMLLFKGLMIFLNPAVIDDKHISTNVNAIIVGVLTISLGILFDSTYRQCFFDSYATENINYDKLLGIWIGGILGLFMVWS